MASKMFAEQTFRVTAASISVSLKQHTDYMLQGIGMPTRFSLLERRRTVISSASRAPSLGPSIGSEHDCVAV